MRKAREKYFCFSCDDTITLHDRDGLYIAQTCPECLGPIEPARDG